MLKIPKAYLLLLIFALMQFSYKDFILNDSYPECFIIIYRILFFIPITSVTPFNNYNYYVYKVIRKSYNVSQAGGAGMSINKAKHREEYYAIVGRNKKTNEEEEICKGSKEELKTIIKQFILPLGIPVYVGAHKKGYEFKG